MNFYDAASENANKLSPDEQKILKYALQNLHIMKDLSIREFASRTFVSTATIFRFVKKLGYNGYSDFREEAKKAEKESRKSMIPMAVKKKDYKDSYLKNITEAINVISEEKIEEFIKIMNRYPKIYLLAEGLSFEVANYLYRILTVAGYQVVLPSHDYEIKSMLRKITQDDVVMVLSFTGDNQHIVKCMEQIFAISTPKIISFTRADNNVIQNMSDLNFYTFADQMTYDDNDITSRCGMIAIFEILMYLKGMEHV